MSEICTSALLNSLVSAIIVVDRRLAIAYVNAGGEHLLQGSCKHLQGQYLGHFIPEDNPVFALISRVIRRETAVSEYRISLDSPRIGRWLVNVHANLVVDHPDYVVLVFDEQSVVEQMDRQLNHRGAVRSATAMSAMLAHEVKNPLSGIRGAAQLLENDLPAERHELTGLIQDEADRIVALVDRVANFSDMPSLKKVSFNIHKVLDRVVQIARNGFGRNVQFQMDYDPSLPFVYGDYNSLIQVFLNLVKNAVEAVPKDKGEVLLSTAYQHGASLSVMGGGTKVPLPLVISVQDNGGGIGDDIRNIIFDPFVTTKPSGSGLGLAQVAKVIDDHGGVIEFENSPGKTIFKIMLPVYKSNLSRRHKKT